MSGSQNDTSKVSSEYSEDELAKIAVDICYTIHTTLGAGLLESVYEKAFAYELAERNIPFVCQKEIDIRYKKAVFENAFRADIVMCDKFLVELKSVETLEKKHHKITLNYMKLMGIKLGILVNFNVDLIKDGIHRKVNGL